MDIERILIHSSTEDVNKMLDVFGIKDYKIDRVDFMSFIADIFATAVERGSRSYVCNFLEHSNFDLFPVAAVAAIAGPNILNLDANTYDVENYAANTTVDFTKSKRQWSW